MRRTRATRAPATATIPPTSGPPNNNNNNNNSNNNNLCFIRLLAFVSVIGSQFHVLSSASSSPTTAASMATAAAAAMAMATASASASAAETLASTTRTNLDAFNTTRAILTTDAQEQDDVGEGDIEAEAVEAEAEAASEVKAESTALFPFLFASKTQSNAQLSSPPTFGSRTHTHTHAYAHSYKQIETAAALKNSKTSIRIRSDIDSDSNSNTNRGRNSNSNNNRESGKEKEHNNKSNNNNNKSINGKGIRGKTTSLVLNKGNMNTLVGSLGPFVVTDSISTTVTAYKMARNASKESTDIATFSKNHWSAASSSTTTTAPYASLSSSSTLASIPSATASASASASAPSPFITAAPTSSTNSTSTSTNSEHIHSFRKKHHHEHHWGPFFEEPLNSDTSGDNLVYTVHLFAEAVLNCRVGMLKDKTVMWLRRTADKVALLTVGNQTYSGDPRIHVKFKYPNNWRLVINPTKKDDAGMYMCQVSTHPPRVSITNLTILEPPIRLVDGKGRVLDDHIHVSDSSFDIQCQVLRSFFQKELLRISKSIQPHNPLKTYTNKFNALDSSRSSSSGVGGAGGISGAGSSLNELLLAISTNQTMSILAIQELEKQFENSITWSKNFKPLTTIRRTSVSDKWLSSRVSIPGSKSNDGGNYSCTFGSLFTVIVQAQIPSGEKPAAVQHNAAASTRPQWLCLVTTMLFVVATPNISTRLAI